MALRVLLADESTTIRKVMQLALQDFAVEVKSVHSGIDVVEVAKTFQPDVIFADVLLQKRNGYEVAGDIKRDPKLAAIPVVLMWSSFMDLDEKLAQISMADRRLEKPFDVENLRQLVLELVPKTRSQRLAHFLKFPDSFAEPMQAEEREKLEYTASNPDESTAPVAQTQPQDAQTPPPLPPRKSKPPPVPSSKAPDLDRTVRVNLNDPAFTVPNLEDAHDPSSAVEPDEVSDRLFAQEDNPEENGDTATAGPIAPSSEWNINSFEDIDVFAEITTTDDTLNAPQSMMDSTQKDSGDEENFTELKLSKTPSRLSDRQQTPEPPALSLNRPATVDDREPWSHQDLSRFKIELPPLELDNYDSNEGPFEIDLSEAESETDLEAEYVTPKRGELSAPKVSSALNPRMQHDPFAKDESEDLTLDHDEAVIDSGALNFELEMHDDHLGHESFAESAPYSRQSGRQSEASLPTLSAERVEEIVRTQAKDLIERIVRRLIPDMATEIIREEVQRLLSEQTDETAIDSNIGVSKSSRVSGPIPAKNRERPPR